MDNYGISQERFEELLQATLEHYEQVSARVVERETKFFDNLNNLKGIFFRGSSRSTEWIRQIDQVIADKEDCSRNLGAMVHEQPNWRLGIERNFRFYYEEARFGGLEKKIPELMVKDRAAQTFGAEISLECFDFFIEKAGVANRVYAKISQLERLESKALVK